MNYEDTVRPEVEPCDRCGVNVDEGDACWLAEYRLCDACYDERLDEMEREVGQ